METTKQARFSELCSYVLSQGDVAFAVQKSLLKKADARCFDFTLAKKAHTHPGYDSIQGDFSAGESYILCYYKDAPIEQKWKVVNGESVLGLKHIPKQKDILGAMKPNRTIFEEDLRKEIIEGFLPTFEMIIESLLLDDAHVGDMDTVWEYLEVMGIPNDIQQLKELFEAYEKIQARKTPLRRILGTNFGEMALLVQDLWG